LKFSQLINRVVFFLSSIFYILLFLYGTIVLFYSSYYVFASFYGGNKNLIKYEHDEFKPRVSIVIATYNEESTINYKLKNILELSYPKEKLELIFVDCSNDRTPETLNAFKENSALNIKIIREEERTGLASALNLGYSLATGELIVKSDCDTFLKSDSIDNIVSFFGDESVGCVSGVGIVDVEFEKAYRDIQIKLRIAESNLHSTYLLDTFSCFRRDLIEPIKKDSAADDAELALAIIKKGYKSLINQKAKFYEHCPSRFKERRKQRDRRAEGHIRLLLQNTDFLFNTKYGYFGVFIFPSIFFMMIILPWMILATIIVSVYALLIINNIIAFFLFVILIISYNRSFLKILKVFLDTQLSLITAHIRILLGRQSYMWEKIIR